MHNQAYFAPQEEVYSSYYPPYYNPMYYPTPPPMQYPYPYYPPPLYESLSSPQQFHKYEPQQYFSTEYVKKQLTQEEVKPRAQRGRPKNKVNQEKRGKATRPKKNVESNISNQVFSFIISEKKSGEATRNIIKNDQKKVSAFYDYVNCLAKYKRKYLNRKYLGDLCILAPESTQYNDIVQKFPKQNYLSMEDFRSVLSMLIFHFLRDRCSLTILTSSKMSSQLRIEHMERRRDILTYMEEYVKPDIRFH